MKKIEFKIMKRVVFAFVLMLLTLTVSAQKGTQSVGFNVGYAFDSNDATLGVDYRYNITDSWRLAPSMTMLLDGEGVGVFALDMNAHYVFPISEMVGFYPLAGVSLAFWDFGSYDTTDFGINFGLGAEIYATSNVTVGLEVKYSLNQPLTAVRVAYSF
jgi:opacity protein-like surface antigen